ncbi:sodium- and chloride-dependent GABA transporter 3-like [Takifugu flavidus]|uniref:sodium- and chloride-dependent GABA transporter 3-like n=1 Tax=Takifugu flavidus TaxID=433684 RepID=UPI00254487EF|nr:sodium- and chloride-dependent GABA transporter 3-like [Takifugu flavidus]
MDRPRKKAKKPKAGGARGQWTSKAEFILVVAGNVVSLGNVWRFPYLCYKNGGGAFLIPYCLLAVVFGIPLFLLETSLGQFTQEGFITCWRKVCPLAQGIGYAQLMVKLASFTYIMVQVWALFYLVFSFRSELPWATCGNAWNTDNCRDVWDFDAANQTANETRILDPTSAATQFWERRLLGLSGGVEELGSVRSELALCLLLCWLFCFFSIRKGVRSMGKVAYLTAIFPFVLLVFLFARAATLPGASDGIKQYLIPQLGRLANIEVWTEAGSEILSSYSLTSGILIVLGSYNPYNNNCYKDAFWICALTSGTSFVAGFIVFSILGFLAQVYSVSIDAVAESGPGLVFIAFPQAAALMPLPQFWSICFFLMLILLAADTHFVCVEAVITSVSDLFPKLLRSPVKHEIISFLLCVSSFLVHLILATQGGNYIFQLIDYYGVTRFCDNFMAICECLAVGWIFGVDRLVLIIDDMTGHKPSIFFKLCWKIFIPAFSGVCFLLYLVYYKPLQLDRYVYPGWVPGLGWFMLMSPVILVPLWIIGHVSLTAGPFRQRLSTLCRPADHPAWQKGRTKADPGRAELSSALMT